MWKFLGGFIPRRCPTCGSWGFTVQERQLNTAYADDSMNVVRQCTKCHKRDWDFWDNQWREYWGTIL